MAKFKAGIRGFVDPRIAGMTPQQQALAQYRSAQNAGTIGKAYLPGGEGYNAAGLGFDPSMLGGESGGGGETFNPTGKQAQRSGLFNVLGTNAFRTGASLGLGGLQSVLGLAANAGNMQNYQDVLKGYEDKFNVGGQLLGDASQTLMGDARRNFSDVYGAYERGTQNLRDEGGRRTAAVTGAFEQGTSEQLAALRGRQDTGMAMLAGQGEQEIKDINTAYGNAAGATQQNLIDRGLTGSGLVGQARLSNMRQRTDALGRARERQRAQQFNAYAGLSGDVTGAIGTQAYGRTNLLSGLLGDEWQAAGGREAGRSALEERGKTGITGMDRDLLNLNLAHRDRWADQILSHKAGLQYTAPDYTGLISALGNASGYKNYQDTVASSSPYGFLGPMAAGTAIGTGTGLATAGGISALMGGMGAAAPAFAFI